MKWMAERCIRWCWVMFGRKFHIRNIIPNYFGNTVNELVISWFLDFALSLKCSWLVLWIIFESEWWFGASRIRLTATSVVNHLDITSLYLIQWSILIYKFIANCIWAQKAWFAVMSEYINFHTTISLTNYTFLEVIPQFRLLWTTGIEF